MAFYPYRPREVVSDLGTWESGTQKFKVYGILAEGQKITENIINNAHNYLLNDIPDVIGSNDENDGLGFVIIHPGELGVSVLVHWWIQGSVLCQHVRRWLWGSDVAIDMSSKHVVACVWELGLINAEQTIWRSTMMNETSSPSNYLATRPNLNAV